MSKITELASARITASDSVTVELGERDDGPALVRVSWPLHPTMIDPKRFADVASEITRLFARAHIVLAAIRAERKL